MLRSQKLRDAEDAVLIPNQSSSRSRSSVVTNFSGGPCHIGCYHPRWCADLVMIVFVSLQLVLRTWISDPKRADLRCQEHLPAFSGGLAHVGRGDLQDPQKRMYNWPHDPHNCFTRECLRHLGDLIMANASRLTGSGWGVSPSPWGCDARFRHVLDLARIGLVFRNCAWPWRCCCSG